VSTSDITNLLAALDLTGKPGTAERLSQYLVLLQQWNGTYNLTAVRDPAAMLIQHLADCLAVVRPLQREVVAGRVLDVGSGGGLPGALLALMRPEWEVTCVDAVAKKAAFVRQVAGALNLRNLRSLHGRVEALMLPEQHVICSRAFASLSDFVQLTERHLHPQGCWMAMKGHHPADELAALPPTAQMFHVEPLQVPGLGAERCLVWMRRNPPAAAASGPDTG